MKELSEEYRQLILMALAELSLTSPRLEEALKRVALHIEREWDPDGAGKSRAPLYEAFRIYRNGAGPYTEVPEDD